MINRKQVESLLKINGLGSNSPDDEIRSILLSAHYNKDEIDTAIMILREDVHTKKRSVEGLHKVFRTCDTLKPKEISELLCIEVEHNEQIAQAEKKREISIIRQISIWGMSFVLAFTGVLFYMYIHKIGLFHPSVDLVFLQ